MANDIHSSKQPRVSAKVSKFHFANISRNCLVIQHKILPLLSARVSENVRKKAKSRSGEIFEPLMLGIKSNKQCSQIDKSFT